MSELSLALRVRDFAASWDTGRLGRPTTALAPETKVTWIDPKTRRPAAALVRKQGEKRVQIELRLCIPYSKPRKYLHHLMWVPPDTLAHREVPSAAFHEALVVHIGPFEITATRTKHTSRNFPDGTWYGCIDGWTVTAPCTSAEMGIAHAIGALTGSGYRVALATRQETYQGWLDRNQGDQQEANDGLADIAARQRKLASFLRPECPPDSG